MYEKVNKIILQKKGFNKDQTEPYFDVGKLFAGFCGDFQWDYIFNIQWFFDFLEKFMRYKGSKGEDCMLLDKDALGLPVYAPCNKIADRSIVGVIANELLYMMTLDGSCGDDHVHTMKAIMPCFSGVDDFFHAVVEKTYYLCSPEKGICFMRTASYRFCELRDVVGDCFWRREGLVRLLL